MAALNFLDQWFHVQWVQPLQKKLDLDLGQGCFQLILGDGSKVFFRSNFDLNSFWCSQNILTKFSKDSYVVLTKVL